MAYAYATRGKFGPAAERMLVSHSILTFPNLVVIGLPVLSAMFSPAIVKVFIGLLLMEQVSLHLTYVAVMAEVFCAKAPAPSVGEHSLGAMHLDGPPLRTDPHGWALNVVSVVLSRTGGATSAEAQVGMGARSASLTMGEELKPRISRGGALQAEHAAALLSDSAPSEEHDAEAASGATAGRLEHVMPEHGNAMLRVLRIIRDRLLHNPMVIGCVGGVITALAVKAHDPKAKLPYVRCPIRVPKGSLLTLESQIIDTTSLYLNNCVLGISLFNFGLFAFVHGIISCGYRRAVETVLLRYVLSPVCCLLVGLMFGFRGDNIKVFTMQGALPQAVSSFVVFKEFKIQPEVFSTSTNVGTLLCLPVMCLWYAIVSGLF